MSATYSININTITESNKLANIQDVLNELADNTSRLITPNDVRDASYTAYDDIAFKPTTVSESLVEYIGIDDVLSSAAGFPLKEKIFLGKRQLSGVDIMNNSLLTSDIDIFIYNTKLDTDLTQQYTKVAFMAGTNSTNYSTSPYLWAQDVITASGSTIDFSIVNPSVANATNGNVILTSNNNYVVINGIWFPTVANTTKYASPGYTLTLGYNGIMQWTSVNGGTGSGLTGPTGATGLNGSANAWGLTGNSGTSPSTNFIGTIDSTDLEFRTNNTQSGYISITNSYTYFGYQSGLSTTATSSTYIGYQAGYEATYATSSVFIGYQSGYTGTNAYSSTFTGYQSGYQATDSYYSVFDGGLSGYQATNANNSVFIGYQSGYQATDSPNSVFIGFNSGYKSQVNFSTFLGNSAGYLSNSSYATFLGSNAGFSSDNTPYSIFIGYESGGNSENAAYCVYIGSNAGYQSTYATSSVFIGYESGYLSSNGAYCTFMGYESGYQAFYATSSIFLGYQAGYNATSAHNSIFIGYEAGNSATSSNNTILIGNYTSAGIYNNSISIGNNVSNTSSNQIIIGSSSNTAFVFYGDLEPGLGNHGASGSVLISQGSGIPPLWSSGISTTVITGTYSLVFTNGILTSV